jgi:BirA family transcriptional regulator, biotin operon repressor / biotin---[acetyl-CoA-carboxylase] ligase
MYSSLAFEPTWPIDSLSLIPLVAGLAVRSAIEDLAGVSVGLAWPNDLMLSGGKVGGILVESGEGLVVVGCGVNLEWQSPMEGAVALDAVTLAPVSGLDLAVAWADRFLARLDHEPVDWGIDEYRAACSTAGRAVTYAGGPGFAVGISDDGSLLVETATGTIAVHSGEVRLHDAATLPLNWRD